MTNSRWYTELALAAHFKQFKEQITDPLIQKELIHIDSLMAMDLSELELRILAVDPAGPGPDWTAIYENTGRLLHEGPDFQTIKNYPACCPEIPTTPTPQLKYQERFNTGRVPNHRKKRR